MQSQGLQDAFGLDNQRFQFVVTALRLHNSDQLDLVELMHANHAARPDAGRSGFRAKTRAVGAVVNRQQFLGQNLVPMNICDRRFGRGQ